MPAGAALFSPWTDLAGTGESLRANAQRDAMFDPRHFGAVARHYLGETDPLTPLASPLFADLRDLPPLLIHAGETEILSPFALKADAEAEAARQLAFLSGPLAIDTHLVPGLRSDLFGQAVTIASSRLGYGAGRPAFVIGVEEADAADQTTLTVLVKL